jgi:HK97 family phage major capsid protein
MKFYIKGTDGKVVEATTDQVLDPKSSLCDEQGVLFNRPSPIKDKDPIKDLENLIGDIAKQVAGQAAISTKVDQMSAELAAYKEATAKGFPIGFKTPEKAEGLIHGYDLAKQGKRLMNKLDHPGYQVPKEMIEPMADFYCLFVRAALMDEPWAKAEFHRKYPSVDQNVKTAIGDTGNTFPIPDIIEAEILAFAREKSIALSQARVVDMVSEKQSYPAESSGVTVAWGNTTGNSEPTVTEVELDAEELSAYSIVKNMTLADSRSDIVSWLTEVMAEATGLELDNVMFNGDGTSTYANCSGLLSAACGYSVVMGSGSTSFADMTADNLSEMIKALSGLKKQGAQYYFNGAAIHYIRILKDNNNRPVFVDSYGSDVPQKVFGSPLNEAIKITGTDAANAAFGLFGNLRNFFVGRRLDSAALSVDPYGLWTTNRTRFKIYQRWGLQIGLANAFCRLLTHA